MSEDREPVDDRETAYDLLQRGHALLEGHHYAQAAIVLERADRLEPAKGSILEALGLGRSPSGGWLPSQLRLRSFQSSGTTSRPARDDLASEWPAGQGRLPPASPFSR